VGEGATVKRGDGQGMRCEPIALPSFMIRGSQVLTSEILFFPLG